MDLRQWLNRLSITVSVPLAIYMMWQPHAVDTPTLETLAQTDPTHQQSPKYYLVKPELKKLQTSGEIQALETKVDSPAFAHKEASLLARAKNFTSIQDFMELPFDQETKDLLGQMQADRFQSENPYHNLSNVYPVALMLSKGVVRWNREVYRSADFNQEYGYDVVRYQVTHQDISTSYIFAYREKSLDQRLWLGEEDQRPTLASFLINRGDGRVFRMSFVNGEITQSDSVDLSVALSNMENKVERATPIASRELF